MSDATRNEYVEAGKAISGLLEKLRHIEADIDDVEVKAAEAISRVQEWRSGLVDPLEAEAESIRSQIETLSNTYRSDVRDDEYPAGVVQRRHKQALTVIDDRAGLAERIHPLGLPHVVEEVASLKLDKRQLDKVLIVRSDGKMFVPSADGEERVEVSEFMHRNPPSDTVTVKVAKQA